MSTDSLKFEPNTSQGDYWGGHMMDYKTFKWWWVINPLSGFFGLDHFALRSPLTAILKLLVNIYTWGSWYVYDILQVSFDNTTVAKYGMDSPLGLLGPIGHGYKFFQNVTTDNIEEIGKPSAYKGGQFMVMIYALSCLFLGAFGIPSFVAGDYTVGVIKLISLIFIFPMFFYFVTSIFDYFNSGSVQKTGVPRSWPLISPGIMPFLLINDNQQTYPAVNLISDEEKSKQLQAHKEAIQKFQAGEPGKAPPKPLLQGFIDVASIWASAPLTPLQTVGAAKGAMLAASDVGQTLATAIQQEVKKDPKAVLQTVFGAAPTAPAIQKGGASEEIAYGLDVLLMGGIAFLAIGGFGVALARKIMSSKRNQEDEYPRKTYERDDAPPNPGGI